MLREIKVSQPAKDGIRRRWFESDYFDLYVWQTEAATAVENDDEASIHGFQLCYNIRRDERALTWKRDIGFFHDGVDSGSATAANTETPILVEDGLYAGDRVTHRFAREAAQMATALRAFVMKKLALYTQQHPVIHRAPTKRKQVRREAWQKVTAATAPGTEQSAALPSLASASA